jgi:hypothetical protein
MDVLIALLVTIIILGLVYWVLTLIPLPPPFRTVALIVFAIIAILVLLSFLGAPGFPSLHLYRK